MYRQKYFTSREIALHYTPGDLWVVLFGKVLDLSSLCQVNKGNSDLFPLLAFGGKDITHFFDGRGEIKWHVDPNSNQIDNFLPFRSLPDAPSQKYTEDIYFKRKEGDEKMMKALTERVRKQKFDRRYKGSVFISDAIRESGEKLPWWKDEKYVVGLLTRKSRCIRIRNTLIMKTVDLEVCSEETIEEILLRYLKFNSHARSYTWKYHGQELDMAQNLEMNGVPDRDFQLNRLRLKEEDFIPTLNLYYKDDLTEM